MATRRLPQLLTPDEAARQINEVLSTEWNARKIVRLARGGQLAVQRVDGRGTVRVHPDAIKQFLAAYVAANHVVPDTRVA